jgi:hypothetical protein
MDKEKEIKFKDVPIHVCDKLPLNKPIIVLSKSKPCPYCGKDFKKEK